MCKTRYTNQLTYDFYFNYALAGFLNPSCKMHRGTFTVKQRFSTELTDEGFRDVFMGQYVTCTCVHAHECFQMGSTVVGEERKFRISSHFPDVVVPVYDRSKAVKKRSK